MAIGRMLALPRRGVKQKADPFRQGRNLRSLRSG